jgi:MFS family permease
MGMLKEGLALFRSKRDFAFLMGAQFAAQAGDGITQAALAKLIAFGGQEGFDLEGAKDPQELLRIVLYIFIPYTIISPFLGVVIDRWDRRRLLMAANGLRALALGAVALAGSADVGDIPLFAAFLFTLAATRVVLATKSAAMPEVVDAGSLVEANAVSQLGGAIFQLGGAGAALIAVGLLPTDPIVLVGAFVYAVGALLPIGIKRIGQARTGETSLAREAAQVLGRIRVGVRHVVAIPQAAAAITTYFWLRLLWSFSIVGIGFIARDLLADDDLKVLLVTGGAGAIGAALGFLSAQRLHAKVRTTGYLVLAASAFAGLATAFLGALTFSFSLAALTFCLGFGFFLGKISLDTMVQEALGDDFRGRAFSLYDIAYNLAWVVAAAILNLFWTGDRRGLLIAGMGVAFLVGLAVIGAWFKRAGLLAPAAGPGAG